MFKYTFQKLGCCGGGWHNWGFHRCLDLELTLPGFCNNAGRKDNHGDSNFALIFYLNTIYRILKDSRWVYNRCPQEKAEWMMRPCRSPASVLLKRLLLGKVIHLWHKIYIHTLHKLIYAAEQVRANSRWFVARFVKLGTVKESCMILLSLFSLFQALHAQPTHGLHPNVYKG